MRLSICIPTFNRAHTLPRLLDSIAQQADHGLTVEVVISDNASTDGTGELVERYRADGLAITYARLPENRGFDRNLLNVMGMATGEFCWLYGSDDIMEPGALAALERTLAQFPTMAGATVALQAYTPDLDRKVHLDDHVATAVDRPTLLSGIGPVIATVGACFGFMSSLVVRRDLWLAAVGQAPLDRYMFGYVHIHVVARIVERRPEWVVLPERLVGYRTAALGGPAPADPFARTRLDITGFDMGLGDVIGRDHPAYRRAMTMVAVYAIGSHFLNAKISGAGVAYWRQAIPTTVSRYWRYPGFWLRTFPIALVPRPAMLGARYLYRRVLKPVRERRIGRAGR
jgi:abequosyltransferase